MSVIEIYEGTKFFPAVCALEVTLRCNMRCLHCGSSATGKPRESEMSLEEWKGVVDQLSDLGCEYFTLSGGEPFVWPHWRELSEYIVSKKKQLAVISNGYSITLDDLRFLKNINVWNIGLSVDGTKESHNRIRQNKESFDRVINVIRLANAEGIKVVVSTSVNQFNFNDLPKLKNILADAGVHLWQVQIVNSFGRANELRDQMIISKKQYAELIDFIHKAQAEYNSGKLKMNVMPADSIGYCTGIAKEIWGDLEWSGCNAGRYVIGIESNGNVLGCLSLQRDLFVAGNVRKEKLKKIWENDEAFGYNRNFNKEKLCGSCKDCNVGEQCRSGCLGMGYSITGELYHNPYCYKTITEEGANA